MKWMSLTWSKNRKLVCYSEIFFSSFFFANLSKNILLFFEWKCKVLFRCNWVDMFKAHLWLLARAGYPGKKKLFYIWRLNINYSSAPNWENPTFGKTHQQRQLPFYQWNKWLLIATNEQNSKSFKFFRDFFYGISNTLSQQFSIQWPKNYAKRNSPDVRL